MAKEGGGIEKSLGNGSPQNQNQKLCSIPEKLTKALTESSQLRL